MVFEHSGGRDFDLPRHSHYSGVIPMVFEHSASYTDRAPSLSPDNPGRWESWLLPPAGSTSYTNEVLHTIVLKGTTGTRCVFICRHSAFRGVFCQPCEKCELIGGREVKTSGTRREKIPWKRYAAEYCRRTSWLPCVWHDKLNKPASPRLLFRPRPAFYHPRMGLDGPRKSEISRADFQGRKYESGKNITHCDWPSIRTDS